MYPTSLVYAYSTLLNVLHKTSRNFMEILNNYKVLYRRLSLYIKFNALHHPVSIKFRFLIREHMISYLYYLLTELILTSLIYLRLRDFLLNLFCLLELSSMSFFSIYFTATDFNSNSVLLRT